MTTYRNIISITQYPKETANNTLEYCLYKMSSNNLSLQPIVPIVDNGMTMDEIVAFSPKPRMGRGLARRHINIALSQEAQDALAEERAGSYLVYSNGLLLTPEGEVANQYDYNLSTEEINRQVNAHAKNPEIKELVDECIIDLSSRFVYSTPPKMPVLTRSECIRFDPLTSCDVAVLSFDGKSPLGVSNNQDEEQVPINLFASEFNQ